VFLRKAKIDLNNCLMNLQKSRSEILVTGDKMEKLEASRLKRRLEEAVIIARNLNSSLDHLIQLVPTREEIEQRYKEKMEKSEESKERWAMKWQLS
jgi:hypothetical protein